MCKWTCVACIEGFLHHNVGPSNFFVHVYILTLHAYVSNMWFVLLRMLCFGMLAVFYFSQWLLTVFILLFYHFIYYVLGAE